MAKNVTLHTDGISKLGHHYSGALVTVEGRSYSMSIDEIASGSADNYFNSVIDAFTDCERLMQYMSPTVSVISRKLIGSCKNLMSDKHVVGAKFATQFEETRRECLPSIIERWDELDQSEKDVLSKINRFHCGLHALGNAGTSAEQTIRLWDLFVCGISLTSGQLINELFPDCTRSCFSQDAFRKLFYATGAVTASMR